MFWAQVLRSLVLSLVASSASATLLRSYARRAGLLRMSAARISAIAPERCFARVPLSEVDAAFALEVASYPADEAATLEKLQLRSESAGDYFWGVSQGGTLQGFVCGTLTTGTMLTEESMSVHEPKVRGTCLRASHHTWPYILSYIPLSYRPLLRPLGAGHDAVHPLGGDRGGVSAARVRQGHAQRVRAAREGAGRREPQR